jgi:FAD/FMN-containing dehydrogenase
MITELFVPRERLPEFMSLARVAILAVQSSVIYGTIRLVKAESDTFLRWASRDWACVILNLHVDHTPAGLAQSGSAFRALIDCAIACSGSYYLTYHRYATRSQLERCYPMFAEFLALKRRYDPDGQFQSDWYRHYAGMFA